MHKLERSGVASRGVFYWLQSKIPISELHGSKCLLRIHDYFGAEEDIFVLDASEHPSLSEYVRIIARCSICDERDTRTTVVIFDQHRANQMKRCITDDQYAFIAEIDLRIPLQRGPSL